VTNATIETYSGKWFDILEPRPEQIDIESIAHALSLTCRFTGHVRYHYSVAQHSLIGSLIIPRRFALEFLLHDASEAYIGDMSRPLKHCTPAGKAYREVEAVISGMIRFKYNLPSEQTRIIHEYDNMMLYAEKEQLMGSLEWTKESTEACECPDSKAAPVTLYEMAPREVEQRFLDQFYYLTKQGEQ
jgi:5'-deoxynucleotidase YfbR-like HD superfamily hydrolase